MAKVDEIKFWQGTEEEWNNGGEKTWYNWKSGESEIGVTDIGTMPSDMTSVVYGNGKFISFGAKNGKFAYSSDGINWTEGDLPNSDEYAAVAYGDGKFVAVPSFSGRYALSSSDGINWNVSTLSTQKKLNSVVYGGDKFVAVGNSRQGMYSSDGINWVEYLLPTVRYMDNYVSVAYGNGRFVAGTMGGIISSPDGINWTQVCSASNYTSYIKVAFANNMFVGVGSQNDIYYSQDGINWTEKESGFGQKGFAISGASGVFVGFYGKGYGIYSKDGINWTQITIPSVQLVKNAAYGKNMFICSTGSSSYLYTIVSPYLSAFTLTETPDTSSKVYSSPSIESQLMITGIGANTFTLSDGNVYDRNQSGDISMIQSIGEAHPDYICYINNVGIKVADKFIAKKDS